MIKSCGVPLGFYLVLFALSANAQNHFRSGEPVVVEAEKSIVEQDPKPAIINAFSEDYKRAKSPKITLFWAVSFDDTIKISTHKITEGLRSENKSSSGLDKNTLGGSGTAVLKESNSSFNSKETKIEKDLEVDHSKVPLHLSKTHSIELKQAFLQVMRLAKLSFIDRDVAIRATSVSNNSVDAKIIESKAVFAKSDLLLEIIPVKDERSAFGIGFQITLKDLVSLQEIASSYTHAVPWMSNSPAKYKATDQGFVLFSGAKAQPSIHDLGTALAIDVMRTIGPSFSKVNR